MATWTGWQSQFLHAAGLINTPPNTRFLTEWAQNANHNCGNNPIDLSEPMPSATKCAANTGVLATVWRYIDHGQAANAFKFELLYPWADDIRKALDSGNPYQYAQTDRVVSDLVSWGSVKYARVFQAATTGSGGGSSGGGGIAPHTHRAWGDLQKSVNKHLPNAARSAQTANRETLRTLSRARKVRL